MWEFTFIGQINTMYNSNQFRKPGVETFTANMNINILEHTEIFF